MHCAGDDQLYRTAAFDGLPAATTVAVGAQTVACVLSRVGEVKCFGSGNETGEFGAGHDEIWQPWETSTPVTDAVDLVAGDRHFCALTSDAVLCWGANGFGQVGVTPPSSSGGYEMIEGMEPPTDPASCRGGECEPTPIAVKAVSGTIDVTAGGDSTCAVTDDAVWCWGQIAGGPSPKQFF